MQELIEKVEQWAEDKGIDKAENWRPQFKKIVEEVMEYKEELKLSEHDTVANLMDEMTEMGDILVTLAIMAQQRGYRLNTCLQFAYDKIKDRQGEVINGSFVKAEDVGKVRKDSEEVTE